MASRPREPGDDKGGLRLGPFRRLGRLGRGFRPQVTDRLVDTDPDGAAATSPAAAPSGTPTVQLSWATVTRATATARQDTAPPRMRRVFAQVVAAAAVVLAVVTVAGAVASRKVAEREAVHDAATTTDLLAEAAVQPALTDDLLTGSDDRGGRAGRGGRAVGAG